MPEAMRGGSMRQGKEAREVEGGSFSSWRGRDFHPEVFKKSSPSQALAVKADLLTEAIFLGLADFLF